MSAITQALQSVLQWIYGFIGDYGWSVVLFTLAFRFCLMPFDIISRRSMKKQALDMARIQPKLDAIKAKYANDQDKLNRKTMELYKKENVSMFGGCAGGCLPLPVPEDVPFYVKDYSEYYKGRAYHPRSLNSNEGWNTIGTMSFLNQPILQYTNEIRSAVLVIHGEKAHSCYMGRDAYAHMMEGNPNPENKELLIIPGAVHTDLYDNLKVIPFDKIQNFFQTYLK